MASPRRRLLLLIAGTLVFLFLVAVLYMLGMARLEDSPRSFVQSLQWAAETLTTTGYGSDSGWAHPGMAAFVIFVQFLGMSLAFLIFPLYVIPTFEQRFEVRLPRDPPKLDDYVLVYRWGPAVATLVGELDRAKVGVVVLEDDEAVARRLVDRGRHVVYGSFSTDEDVDPRIFRSARAVVLNGSDPQNGAFVLAARQHGYEGELLALVENPLHRKPMMLAGATAAYTPRHVLAAALAGLAGQRTASRVDGMRHLGGRLEVAELRVHRGSELMGKTLAEAGIRSRTRATVVGLWRGGEFLPYPPADTALEEGVIIVAVGGRNALTAFGALARPLDQAGGYVVCGYGEVGFKVAQVLRDVGETVCSIDREDRPGVDFVGDALDPEVLKKAGVKDARGVILVMGGDSTTLFAASVVRDLAPEVPIIARVDRVENIERIHRAGADFARALGQVSGQILANKLLGDEWLSLEARVKLVEVDSAGLVGSNPAAARVGQRTGCTIIAVARGDEVIVDLDDDLEIQRGDQLYLCGTEDAVETYFSAFPGSRLD